MAAAVALAFGGRAVEVFGPPALSACVLGVGSEVALSDLAKAAEAQLGLHPESFDFFDAHGRIDTAAGLQRALRVAAAKGPKPLALEVREKAVWAKLREMDAKIRSLTDAACIGGGPVPVPLEAAFAAHEQRVLAKVELALSEVRQAGLKALETHLARPGPSAVVVVSPLPDESVWERSSAEAELLVLESACSCADGNLSGAAKDLADLALSRSNPLVSRSPLCAKMPSSAEPAPPAGSPSLRIGGLVQPLLGFAYSRKSLLASDTAPFARPRGSPVAPSLGGGAAESWERRSNSLPRLALLR